MNQPRLLLIVPAYAPQVSGYAHACLFAARGYRAAGYQVSVLHIGPQHADAQMEEGIQVYRYGRSSGEPISTYSQRELGGEWAGVVIETLENADLLLPLLDSLQVAPDNIAVRIHAATETEVFVAGESEYHRRMFGHAKAVVARLRHIWSTTRYYLDYVRQHYCDSDLQRYSKQYALLPNFPADPAAAVAPSVPTRPSQRTLVALGRMNTQGIHQKNLLNLVDALFLLARTSAAVLDQVRLVLIGDGDARAELELRIRSLGLERWVQTIPELSNAEVRALLGQAHGAILLSQYEGHSVFGMESMELGCPLLYLAGTGFAEYMQDGVSGIAVADNDCLAIAEGLRALLSASFERQLVAASYQQRFGLGVVVERASALLALLTADKRSARHKLLVVGCGDYYLRVKPELQRLYQVVLLADNAPQRQGELMDGLQVMPVAAALAGDYQQIFIASSYHQQIEQQLLAAGVEPERIVPQSQAQALYERARRHSKVVAAPPEPRLTANLQGALQLLPLLSSAEYVKTRMAVALRRQHARAVMDDALALVGDEPKGLVLEFGVFQGNSINYLADKLPHVAIFGFDSFQGLPEDWRPGFAKGHFALARLPSVRANVNLVRGWFDECLPAFLDQHEQRCALVHIDCDLYSSTHYVLEQLRPRLQPGTVIVFDEYCGYDEWQDGEFKAWQEFVARYQLNYRYLSVNLAHTQVAVVIEP